MKAPRNQLFLERRSYRLRRLGDAARMLPVLGLMLFLLPLFWAQDAAGVPRQTAWDAIYLFVVWAGLIVLAGILSRRLSPLTSAAEEREATVAPPVGDGRAGE